MNQGNLSENEPAVESAPRVNSDSQPDNPAPAVPSEAGSLRLAMLQQAYLLEQLAPHGVGSVKGSDLNKKISAAAKRELELSNDVANKVRNELAMQNYLEVSKKGRTVIYSLSEAGRAHLQGLERPALRDGTRPPVQVDEAAIQPEVREAQNAFLLLQLLDSDGQAVSKGDANKIPKSLSAKLGLRPAVANYRRAKLADQNYLLITPTKRSEEYSLTPDGRDYLAAGARHYEHAVFPLKGKTLNTLVTAARESSFERDRHESPAAVERQLPNQTELAEAVLVEFRELRSERHSRSGLVPIHEVRQRIVDRFGPAAARHDVLDEIILGLWRENRLGLEAISNLGDATEQQLNEGIQGNSGTLFYLEAPREQSVASESV
jgi:hypothetical protein